MKIAKRVVETCLGFAFRSPFGRAWLGRRLRHRRNVVYYHWVGGQTPHYAEFYQGCTLERFRQDLLFLQRFFQIVPLTELLRSPFGSDRSEHPRLAVTFDDGFNLNHPELLQVLRDLKVQVTTLLITDCLDNRHLMWRNQLSVIRHQCPPSVYVPAYNSLMDRVGYPRISGPAALMRASFDWEMSRKDELASELWTACGLPPVGDYLASATPYFSRDGLAAWLREGHSIGLHTRTHPRCSRLSPREIDQEIIAPASALKAEFNLRELTFSYPFGDRLSPEDEARVVSQAGLACALGINGFSTPETPVHRLERQNLEGAAADWGIVGRAALRGALSAGGSTT